ncbi:hypothetical protein VTK73DRAFT_4691 [Phialemonium thermophilum]|uniref:Uncharacterized protein n=1 Tax=Phialemonium thermophilum TaxID=223376 RepID=A0ABR3V6S8_9PEZI
MRLRGGPAGPRTAHLMAMLRLRAAARNWRFASWMRAALRRKCSCSSGSGTLYMTFLSLLRYVSALVLSSASRKLRTMRTHTRAFSMSDTRRCEVSSGISARTRAAAAKSSSASYPWATSSRSSTACSTKDDEEPAAAADDDDEEEVEPPPDSTVSTTWRPTRTKTSGFCSSCRTETSFARTGRVATTPSEAANAASATAQRSSLTVSGLDRFRMSERMATKAGPGSGEAAACARASPSFWETMAMASSLWLSGLCG